MEKIIVAAIPREFVPAAWCKCSPWLTDGLARGWSGGMTLEDIYDDCAGGRYLLFMIAKDGEPCAAVVVESVGSVCSIVVAGGRDLASWRDSFLQAWERLAREIGADTLLVAGRPGWARELRGCGYDVRGVILEKPINREGVH